MDRPLTVEKLATYVADWFEKQLQSQTFVTRAAYNKMLHRKTSATIRVLKTLSPKADLPLEISLRREISLKCVFKK